MNIENNDNFIVNNLELLSEIHSYVESKNIGQLKTVLLANSEILHCNLFYNGTFGLLNYAAIKGNAEICKCLVSLGINVDACAKNNNTPLAEASSEGNIETVKWLVENGARIDALPTSTSTPLMNAIVEGHSEIAIYLIQHGANINHLHPRLHETPLDLANIWGRDNIANILRTKSAISALTEIDWSKEYGGPIIQYVNDIAGHVLPIEIVKISSEWSIGQRIALVNKHKNKFLFTIGLFAFHNPMIELFIVLPEYWNLHDKCPQNQFPSSLLLAISDQISKGLTIDEGFNIHAEDPAYKHLFWPPGIAGFCICNHYWGRNRQEKEEIPLEDKVFLLTLIPVKRTKRGFPVQSIEKNRLAGWNKLTLNLVTS